MSSWILCSESLAFVKYESLRTSLGPPRTRPKTPLELQVTRPMKPRRLRPTLRERPRTRPRMLRESRRIRLAKRRALLVRNCSRHSRLQQMRPMPHSRRPWRPRMELETCCSRLRMLWATHSTLPRTQLPPTNRFFFVQSLNNDD